jgi:hypothetical protein
MLYTITLENRSVLLMPSNMPKYYHKLYEKQKSKDIHIVVE